MARWLLVSGVLRALVYNFFNKCVQGTGGKRARKKKWKHLRSLDRFCEGSLGNFPHRIFPKTPPFIKVSSLNAIFVSSLIGDQDMFDGCAWVFESALYAFLLYDCEAPVCALICIISFLSFFPSQFSTPFCPEKLNNFLFWQQSNCLVGVKMSFSAVSSCCIPQARFPDRSPCVGTGAGWGAAGVLLLMAVPGRGCWGPPWLPRGGLGRATRRVPASGGTRQPAKSPQSRWAGSPCQIPRPLAQCASSEALQHRLGVQPLHCPATSAGGFLPGQVASYTRTQCPALGEVQARSPPLQWAGVYSWAVCSSTFWREVAELQEQRSWQKGCSRPVLWLLGGCVGKHKLPSLTQMWPCWKSYQPHWVTWVIPVDLLSLCVFGYSPCVLQVSRGQPFLCCFAPKHTVWWQQQSAWSCLEVPCRLEAWVQTRAIQCGACLLGLWLRRI